MLLHPAISLVLKELNLIDIDHHGLGTAKETTLLVLLCQLSQTRSHLIAPLVRISKGSTVNTLNVEDIIHAHIALPIFSNPQHLCLIL